VARLIPLCALSTGLGLVVLAAARIAQAGGSLNQVVDEAKEVLKKVKLFGVLETLKYLLAGGRITKARAIVGSLLNIKPILTMHDGEIVQFGMARSYAKGIDKLYELVSSFPDIKEVAIVQSTVPDEAAALEKRISTIIPKEKIIMSRLGAGLGVHGGPGTLVVFIRQA
jgi:DegV family protein with EDD domain